MWTGKLPNCRTANQTMSNEYDVHNDTEIAKIRYGKKFNKINDLLLIICKIATALGI